MSEHTAGPWEAEGENGEVFADVDGKRAVVARAYAWDGDGRHMDRHDALRSGRTFVRFANARLIAAAPDLLKALERINDVITRQWLDSEPGFESDPDDLLRDCATIAGRAITRAPEHRREP